MADLFINRISKTKQYIFSVFLVCATSIVCRAISPYIGYKVVAFILLVIVSFIAMFFDILPVLLAAVLSALIWDYFFIPPYFTFQVGTTEDTILLFMYFIVALVSGVLTYKIRQIEKVSRQKEEKANTVKLYNTLLNSLSHELRTPIAAIIGATDNLQRNDIRLTSHNRFELIAEISKASFRLNRQVDNLLNMSRLESGFLQPKKDWCDIDELVYHVINRIEENKISSGATIYPNPASDAMNIKFNSTNSSFKKIQLVDLTGRTVKEISSRDTQTELNVSEFSNGIYFLNIQIFNAETRLQNTMTYKIIVSHE